MLRKILSIPPSRDASDFFIAMDALLKQRHYMGCPLSIEELEFYANHSKNKQEVERFLVKFNDPFGRIKVEKLVTTHPSKNGAILPQPSQGSVKPYVHFPHRSQCHSLDSRHSRHFLQCRISST